MLDATQGLVSRVAEALPFGSIAVSLLGEIADRIGTINENKDAAVKLGKTATRSASRCESHLLLFDEAQDKEGIELTFLAMRLVGEIQEKKGILTLRVKMQVQGLAGHAITHLLPMELRQLRRPRQQQGASNTSTRCASGPPEMMRSSSGKSMDGRRRRRLTTFFSHSRWWPRTTSVCRPACQPWRSHNLSPMSRERTARIRREAYPSSLRLPLLRSTMPA